MNTDNSLKEQFLTLIENGDFESAESILASDIFAVEDMMDEISEEVYKKLDPHWSAVFTGEQITSPIFLLKEISDEIKFKEGSRVIDIGSGHGHPGLVFAALNPTINVIGYDIVKEKILGAKQSQKRLNLKNIEFIEQDLSDPMFLLPEAEYYYLYNPVNFDTAKKIVERIWTVSINKDVTIISVGGKDIKFFKDKGFEIISSLPKRGVSFLKRTA